MEIKYKGAGTYQLRGLAIVFKSGEFVDVPDALVSTHALLKKRNSRNELIFSVREVIQAPKVISDPMTEHINSREQRLAVIAQAEQVKLEKTQVDTNLKTLSNKEKLAAAKEKARLAREQEDAESSSDEVSGDVGSSNKKVSLKDKLSKSKRR